MAKIKNVSDGPRVIHAIGGAQILQAGEERDDIELSDAEAASAARTGWFDGLPKAATKKAPPDKPDEPAALKDMTKADLIELAKTEGVDLPSGNINKDEIIALIELKRLEA